MSSRARRPGAWAGPGVAIAWALVALGGAGLVTYAGLVAAVALAGSHTDGAFAFAYLATGPVWAVCAWGLFAARRACTVGALVALAVLVLVLVALAGDRVGS